MQEVLTDSQAMDSLTCLVIVVLGGVALIVRAFRE